MATGARPFTGSKGSFDLHGRVGRHAGRHRHQRVAVRRGAAPPAPVPVLPLAPGRLSMITGCLSSSPSSLATLAREGVVRAAGRVRHDDGDGLGGVGALGEGRAGTERCRCSNQAKARRGRSDDGFALCLSPGFLLMGSCGSPIRRADSIASSPRLHSRQWRCARSTNGDIDHLAVHHIGAHALGVGLVGCLHHLAGVGDLFVGRPEDLVGDGDLARVDAGLAQKAESGAPSRPRRGSPRRRGCWRRHLS